MVVYSILKCFFKRAPTSEQFDTIESARDAFVALADELMDMYTDLHKVMLYKTETMEDGEIIITDIESMSWHDAFAIANKNGF